METKAVSLCAMGSYDPTVATVGWVVTVTVTPPRTKPGARARILPGRLRQDLSLEEAVIGSSLIWLLFY